MISEIINPKLSFMSLSKKLSVIALILTFNFTFSQSNTPCTAGSISAPALTVGASCSYTAGTTVGATAQTNAANGGTPSCGSMSPDVWYSFVAPASGGVDILTTAGSISDGVMSLYSGSCGSLTELACDDDSNGSMPEISQGGLTPGATYLIRFWEYFSGTGTFNICVTALAPPAGNTTCTVQTPICSGSPIIFTANTGGAAASTVNPGNAYGCLSTSPNPSWYYLQIATGGNLVVDITAGSDVDFAIWGPFATQAAGNAACNTYGAPLDCSYSIAAVEQVNLNGVISGQVYVLLVTNYANTVQSITVSNAGGTATTNCAIVTLPVGFTNWDAYLAKDKVRMNWTTDTETNCDFFAVERSNDGIVWETISFIDGHGTSATPNSYTYTDEHPKEGINYYRLKQVDSNGDFVRTSIVPVEYNVITKLGIYPNPTKGQVFIQQDEYPITSVELVGIGGRKTEMDVIKAENGVSVDCGKIATGTYTVVVVDEMGNSFSSILIVD